MPLAVALTPEEAQALALAVLVLLADIVKVAVLAAAETAAAIGSAGGDQQKLGGTGDEVFIL